MGSSIKSSYIHYPKDWIWLRTFQRMYIIRQIWELHHCDSYSFQGHLPLDFQVCGPLLGQDHSRKTIRSLPRDLETVSDLSLKPPGDRAYLEIETIIRFHVDEDADMLANTSSSFWSCDSISALSDELWSHLPDISSESQEENNRICHNIDLKSWSNVSCNWWKHMLHENVQSQNYC